MVMKFLERIVHVYCHDYHNRDFAFFVFERTLSQPRRHLRSHLATERLSSEATTSCSNRDAPALPEHDQRAVISFFNGVVITKSSIAT